jgi:hypothetical protein
MKRICTNRDFDIEGDVETISIDDHGTIWWHATETQPHLNIEEKQIQLLEHGCGFPVDIDFTEQFFANVGRTLDRSKLPSNTILYPYQQWCA